ncbi:ankyrin repeat domain-containing protein 26 isoform X4 [Pseudophryne corroboree]|uniref:ankyrin repeat domain-containing protein 26 isoform X4 n=1 Tax=Pseudophryne corroboree TaxID=495146 RepID=UPI003081A492
MKKIFSFGKKKKSGPSLSASETGSVQSVGYELKDKDLSKVHRAASSGDVAKLRQLLPKQDINQLDKENRAPLHLACANGHLDAVKLLVENKAKLNLCDNDNRSPLMKAIQCQHEHCAAILLEHEADPNVADINGNAALHLAALIPSMSIASQLLEHGANIDAVNKEGCNPLILAVIENHQTMVEFLIKEGANVNSQDKQKRTSLIIGACSGNISLVKHLLQNNADISIKDQTGLSAEDYAVMNGHHACSHLIIEHGERNKHNASPYFGAVKKKGSSMFSSPDRVQEGGFTLGSPALDKAELQMTSKQTSRTRDSEKGTDEISQAESDSRASGEANSWPSSDEDDLDFSPKKTSKPSLTQLLHAKKNVKEKDSFTTAQPRGFALQSKSDSEEDSVHDSEDEDVNIQSPAKPFAQAHSFPHPVYFTPGSFTKPSQLASASLLNVKKEELSAGDESDEDDVAASHSGGTDISGPVKVQPGGESTGRKVLMSELGFEEDEVDSPWDSESASESPRKQSSSDLPQPAVQVPMQCISEESNEEVSEKITAQQTNKNNFLQFNNGSSTNLLAKSFENNNKQDLMADLGLDDADDIEDASDWDSTSHSLGTHGSKSVSQSHNKLNDSSSPKTERDNVAPKGFAAVPSIPLHSVPEVEQEDRMNRENDLLNGKVLPKDQDDILAEHEKDINLTRQMKSEKLKSSGVSSPDVQTEPNVQLQTTNSKSSLCKGLLGKHVDENHEMNDDMDDSSHSSDTATEDYELPTSTFRNSMLLIEQLNLDGQDSLNLLKIQNIIHEYERIIEKEKGQHALLSREVKKLRNERKEMQQVMETNRDLRSMLEQHKVEWESDINNLRFTLKQEEEKRQSAEMLFDKSKEQLRKKENQCCKEMEEKQQLELTLRNLELEMRSLRNSLKQVEEERSETQRLYAQEHSARVLQDAVLNNMKKSEEEESKKLLAKSFEVQSQPSETSEKVATLTQHNITLQDENNILKQQLEQVRSHCQEEESRYIDENEMLKEKIEDLRKDLKMNEESFTQTVIQCNGQLNALKTETTMLCSKLEHEKQGKERLETELEAVRSRLNSGLQELEKSQAIKTDTERTLQRERDEWLRSKDKLTHELSSLRENSNNLSQQLSRAEAKANGLENELHRTGLSLQERALFLESTQRDLTQAQCKIKDLEQTLQVEKDQISKSTIKQESMQERLAHITSENMQLRQQLEEVQNKDIIKEKTVSEAQDRFTDLFSKLRADSERQVHIIEERNKDLINKSNEHREQIYKLETEKVERESTIRQLQQELADALKKLSMSEASLEVITRYRNALEEEKQYFLKELEKLRAKLQDLEDQYIQSERRNHQLKNALDDKERDASTAFQKVQEFSFERAAAEKAVKQLEDHVQKLEIENAKIEATAKQQMGQIDILQKELHEAVSIRNRLEDLVTNLQSSKIGLEEKINNQVHKQTALSQSAHESHNLWEEELKSRSRLGIRLAELERSNSTLADQVGTEKKKVKKLVDMKKSIEERFDQEVKRNNDLQREVMGLKKLLKNTKKKLKEFEASDREQNNLKEGARSSHHEMDSEVLKLKEKVEELSSHLEKESRKYMQLESATRDTHEQMSSMKILQKSNERLERSKRLLEEEVAELRRHIDSSKMDHGYMEKYKREIDERGRQEVQQKLEEVNLFFQVEQMRAENDASIRNQLEHRIEDLESELNRLKSTQQENISHKDATQLELNRVKDLYAEEQRNRKSLTSKLERANERVAESNAKLLNERQRSKSLIASSFLSGSLVDSPVLDTSPLANLGNNLTFSRSFGLGGSFFNSVSNDLAANRVESYIAKMQQELEKNITKELDQANAELDVGCTRVSPVGSIAGSLRNLHNDQDPVSRAKQQYLEVLKKNYKI